MKKKDFFINNNNKILEYGNSGEEKYKFKNNITNEKIKILSIKRIKKDSYFELSSEYDIEEFKEGKNIKRIIPFNKFYLKSK